MLSLGILLTLPLIILTGLEVLFSGGRRERIYGSCKEILSLMPTTCGKYLRLAYYWSVCQRVSPDADFQFGSMLAHRDTVVGPGTVLGSYSIIGHADIGRNVLIAARVSVVSGKYQHGRPGERLVYGNSSGQYSRIRIGDFTWIGEGALILASIGSNCTVGAGSVVMKEFSDNSTIIGNPARKVNIDQPGQVA